MDCQSQGACGTGSSRGHVLDEIALWPRRELPDTWFSSQVEFFGLGDNVAGTFPAFEPIVWVRFVRPVQGHQEHNCHRLWRSFSQTEVHLGWMRLDVGIVDVEDSKGTPPLNEMTVHPTRLARLLAPLLHFGIYSSS